MADVNELRIRRDASKIDSVVSDGSNLSGRSFGAFRGSGRFFDGRTFICTYHDVEIDYFGKDRYRKMSGGDISRGIGWKPFAQHDEVLDKLSNL